MKIFVISDGIHAGRRPHALNSDATASRLGGKRLKNNERGEDVSDGLKKNQWKSRQ